MPGGGGWGVPRAAGLAGPATFPAGRDLSRSRLVGRVSTFQAQFSCREISLGALNYLENIMAAKNEFFAIGFASGVSASNWLASSVEALSPWIESACGVAPLTPESYKTTRAAWVAGYEKGNACTQKRAENAWSQVFAELSGLYGIKKPQSVAAAKKAGERAAKPADKPAKPAKPDDTVTPPLKGVAAAAATKATLSGIEAHIVDLFRRGKFKDAVDFIQMEAAKAAPF